MFFHFGKFAHAKGLVKALRQHPLDPVGLEHLLGLFQHQEQREALPRSLLWKMHVLADKAMHKLPEGDARYPLLREIRRGALWEIQSREIRGI